MVMLYGVLGPLWVRGQHDVRVSSPARRRLLSILLLFSRTDVPADVLVDRLWSGEPPCSARNALQAHISGLRRLIGAAEVETTQNGYRMRIGRDAVDADVLVARFEHVLREMEEERWPEVIQGTDCALAMFRGVPYVELVEDAFARPEITRLEEIRQQLLEVRVRAMLAVGRNQEALPEIERLVAEEPYREHLWALLIVSRFRLGLQRRALQAYDDAVACLGEVGLTPGDDLADLTAKVAGRATELAEGAPALW